MAKTKKELRTELEAKNKRVNEILDARGDDDFTNDEVKELEKLENEMLEVETDLKSFESVDGARDRARDRDAFMNDPVGRPNQGARGDDHQAKTLGAAFVQSQGIDAYLKSVRNTDGRVSDSVRIHSPQFDAKHLMKAVLTGTGATSAGATVFSQRTEMEDMIPRRELVMRDLVTIGQTTSDVIEYARMTSRTNNAAPVAEATLDTDASGTKPQSIFAFDVQTANVKTIAHWIAATRRALSDAPQLQSLIDNELRDGLAEALEMGMISGNGTGENFLGILNTPGIQEQVFVTDMLTTLRKARTKAKTPGRVTPNGILLNPLDAEKLDLTKDGELRFYFGGPTEMGNLRVWGMTVVECEDVLENTAIVADFKKATLYDRMAATIMMTDSHADFFVRNLIAILGELRAAFVVRYPQAFVKTALTV